MNKVLIATLFVFLLSGCTNKDSELEVNTPDNDYVNREHNKNNKIFCNENTTCPQITCVKAPCPQYECINSECILDLENSQENKEISSKTAKYKIEFIADWSGKTHPDFYSKNAHFSPFVAYSHNNSDQAKIFVEGGLATAGVEDMAETGATGILVKEIENIIKSNNAYEQTRGKRIDSPDRDFSELKFSQDYSNVTFVSMLAPSPDWFVAGSTNLFENGDWKDRVEIDLITFDAGTDDGVELTSVDKDSDPKQPIKVFNDNLQKLGKVVLTKIEE